MIEKLPMSAIPQASKPTGNFESHIYNPVEDFEKYDIEESEEAFPERFKKLK